MEVLRGKNFVSAWHYPILEINLPISAGMIVIPRFLSHVRASAS
jgi:hypothetical protein